MKLYARAARALSRCGSRAPSKENQRPARGFFQSGVPCQKNFRAATCDARIIPRVIRKPGIAGPSLSGFGYHVDRLRVPLPPKL